MKRMIFSGILVVAAGCGALMAQAPAPAPAPAAGPKVKSNEEAKAVNAMIQAQSAGPDAVIKAADDLITRFSDTDFKEIALTFEATAYQQKGDFARTEVIDQDILKLNPKSYQASLQLGEMMVNHTGENDLDRDEKLAQVEKYLNAAIEEVKVATKPNPRITDGQWEGFKKSEIAQAQSDLGKASMLRKKYDDAIANYKAANDTDPAPAYQAYMALAYQKAGKNDEALALCDKVLAAPQLNSAIKSFTLNVQKTATAAKSAPK